MTIHRRHWLNGTGLVAASVPLGRPGTAKASPWGASAAEEDIFTRMVKGSDSSVPKLLSRQEQRPGHRWLGGWADDFGIHSPMGTSGLIRTLAAVYLSAESGWYRRKDLVPRMEQAVKYLLAAQHGDGTIDLYTTNFHSPPDTAFAVEPLCDAVAVIRKFGGPELKPLAELLGRFLAGAARALCSGGIHTPNHRWVVCASLARIHDLYPQECLTARIDDWLGEGIDIDGDGQYTERSTTIYSPVVDRSFLALARLRNRPELLEPVRRNLEMTLFYLHADGEVATEGSRRQDQFQRGTLAGYYLPYRSLALSDRNGRFAATAKKIEEKSGESLSGYLAQFMAHPELRKSLPDSAPLPEDFFRHFSHSGLVRIRRGPVSATVLANNPTLLTFRKGAAVLEALRLASAFFGKGQFVSPTMEIAGNEMRLSQQLEGPYYQPLPPAYRRRDGDWFQMDRSRRPQSEVQKLDTVLIVREKDGRLEMDLEILGCERVPVAVEFCFRKGGELSGVVPVSGVADAFLLEKGMGRYRAEGQEIMFGEGQADHGWTLLRGALPKPNALSVYLTGFTPFRKRLTLA